MNSPLQKGYSTHTPPPSDCFGAPTVCHNCLKKSRYEIQKSTKEKETYRRCSGCMILAYCDEECQIQHWREVHRHHCGRLLGENNFQNHQQNTCKDCQTELSNSGEKLDNLKYEEARCHIGRIMNKTKEMIRGRVGFHKISGSCECNRENPCQIPFAIGEISGEYRGKEFERIIAHIQKILVAIITKVNGANSNQLKKAEKREKEKWAAMMFSQISKLRTQCWMDELIFGDIMITQARVICEFSTPFMWIIMENLGTQLGGSSAWYRALIFTVSILDAMINLRSLYLIKEDAINPELRLCRREKRLQEIRLGLISTSYQTESWDQVIIWPKRVDGILTIRLPDKNSQCMKVYWPQQMITQKDSIKEYQREVVSLWSTSKSCDTCMKYSAQAHRCACKGAQYCSKNCQRVDYKYHKKICEGLPRNKRIASSKVQKERLAKKVEYQWGSNIHCKWGGPR